MEQGHPVADALPPMTGPGTIGSRALKQYRWEGWNAPRYDLRLKDSYAILRKVFQSMPASPPATPERPSQAVAQGGGKTPRSPRKGGAGPSGR
jgi:hypothetical protein